MQSEEELFGEFSQGLALGLWGSSGHWYSTEGLKEEMIITNGGKLPKEGTPVPEQARCDNRVGGRRRQNHESSWLKPRCKGKGLCSPSNDPGFMPDHWPFMAPAHARPWAKCWDHRQGIGHFAHPSKAYSPGIEAITKDGGSERLGEPTEGAPCSAFRIRNDF